MPPYLPLALRAKAAAAALSISERHLFDLTRNGVIPCVRVGGGSRQTKLYSVEALQRWLTDKANEDADSTSD